MRDLRVDLQLARDLLAKASAGKPIDPGLARQAWERLNRLAVESIGKGQP